jgi:hypothetical protein
MQRALVAVGVIAIAACGSSHTRRAAGDGGRDARSPRDAADRDGGAGHPCDVPGACLITCDDVRRCGDEPCTCDDRVFPTECVFIVSECCRLTARCLPPSLLERTMDCAPDCGTIWCEGYMPPPPDRPMCRNDAGCPSGEACVAPGDPAICGVMPVRECESDPGCPGRAVCQRFEGPCGEGTRCTIPCTDSGACEDGWRCADDGLCNPIPCTDGWECPASAICDPPSGDLHGCVRRICMVDTDCDCGACVDYTCHDGPGTCYLPAP